jgi:hypothetical protein
MNAVDMQICISIARRQNVVGIAGAAAVLSSSGREWAARGDCQRREPEPHKQAHA